MPTPDQLEQAADRLRTCARSGRTKAQALATHLDSLVTKSGDDKVWKGPYPTKATGDLKNDQSALGRAAELLRQDADAWDKKATDLDRQAEDLRKELKAKAAKEKAAQDKQKAGAH